MFCVNNSSIPEYEHNTPKNTQTTLRKNKNAPQSKRQEERYPTKTSGIKLGMVQKPTDMDIVNEPTMTINPLGELPIGILTIRNTIQNVLRNVWKGLRKTLKHVIVDTLTSFDMLEKHEVGTLGVVHETAQNIGLGLVSVGEDVVILGTILGEICGLVHFFSPYVLQLTFV